MNFSSMIAAALQPLSRSLRKLTRRVERLEAGVLANATIERSQIKVGTAWLGELPDGTLGMGTDWGGSIKNVNVYFTAQQSELDAHEAELQSQDGRISALGNRMIAAEGTISSHTSTLASHTSTLSSHTSSISNLSGRMGTAEGLISGLQSQINGLPDYGSDVSAITASLQDFNHQLVLIRQRLDALEAM